jgi:succinate-semialdehyde dehydrogenase/glutarate-semialdehyde dehydrogenase
VFTRDLARGQRMVEGLRTGMTGPNVGVVSDAAAPFGGWQRSGIAPRGGAEGIDEIPGDEVTLTPDPFG